MLGKNYINGKWCEGKNVFTKINPCTEEEVGHFPQSSKLEVATAVSHANAAFLEWRKESRVRRSEYFDKLAQLIKRDLMKLAEVISEETGKSINESRAEVLESLHMIQYVAGQGRESFGDVMASELATKDAYFMRKPKGVIAVVAPFNFPLAIGATWTAAPAILEGNTVVLKPSELAPKTSQLAAELYDEAGFPPGVFNMVQGADETGKLLVEHSLVQTILFTGSAEVGQLIRQHCATTWHKTCSCEMGSKSAVMVFGDGNIELALDVTIASAFKLSGQRCVSSGRILVQRNIFESFANQFVERANKLTIGDPFNADPADFGPLISREQQKRVESYNAMVSNDPDAEVLLSNDVPFSKGYYVSPFVYECEWGDKRFLKEEVFGPHVALIPFDSVSDAIKIYNDTDYGLALGCVTNDYRVMRRVRDECDTGMLYLNGGSIAAESHMPFGGVGKSGNGYKSASRTYRAVTEEIAVTVNYEDGISWCQGMK